jgi:hypothetical protein
MRSQIIFLVIVRILLIFWSEADALPSKIDDRLIRDRLVAMCAKPLCQNYMHECSFVCDKKQNKVCAQKCPVTFFVFSLIRRSSGVVANVLPMTDLCASIVSHYESVPNETECKWMFCAQILVFVSVVQFFWNLLPQKTHTWCFMKANADEKDGARKQIEIVEFLKDR